MPPPLGERLDRCRQFISMELVSGNPLLGDKFTTELTNHSTVGEEKEKIFAIWWSRAIQEQYCHFRSRKMKGSWKLLSLGSVKNKLKLYIIKNTKPWGEKHFIHVYCWLSYKLLSTGEWCFSIFFSFWFSKVFSPRLSSSTEKLKDNRFLFSNQGQNEKIEDQDEKECWK